MTERIGQYELLERFAEGGMAEVYFARLVGVEGFRRACAVKRLLPEYARRPEIVAMFLDEARLAASLLHPAIVQVFDLGASEGAHFMAMELVDGPHLGRLFAHSLRIRKALPIELCAWIVAQAAEGLHHAHTRVDPMTGRTLGIVHRDMSPHNILVSRWGDVKVTDFGIAKMRKARSRTKTGVLKGKLGYLSPEQCLGRPLDARSDVFALGIVLYEMLARKRLYKAGSELEVMQRITTETPVSPAQLTPEVDEVLADIALRALAKAPDQRFQSAQELADALSAWLGRRGVTDIRAALSFWVRTHAGTVWPTPEERARRWQSLSVQGAAAAAPRAPRPGPPPGMRLRTRALDTPTTSFIGRAAALADLRRLLTGDTRWVGLVGPAGVGKSRLALEFLHRESAHWRDEGGTWRVDLSAAHDALSAASVVARHLTIPLVGVLPDRVPARVASALAARGSTLLVLDTVDGLGPGMAPMLRDWLRQAPDLRLVTVGRMRLGLPEETLVDVLPLTLPRAGKLSGSEAVLLFAARAAQVRPGFRVATADPDVIGAIVHHLDGLPLALELAAARLEVLDPAELLARLRQGLDILDGGSLSQALEGAWGGLRAAERDALVALTVFRGGFDLEAAEAVVGAEALNLLDTLRDRSLVRTTQGANGAPRFDLMNSTRAFVVQHATPATLATARDRHAASFARRAAIWVRGLHRHGGPALARQLQVERGNLWRALQHLSARGDAPEAIELAAALLRAADPGDAEVARTAAAGDTAEGRDALTGRTALDLVALAERAGAAGSRLVRMRASALLRGGRPGEARRAAERALADAGDDSRARGEALLTLGAVARAQGNLAEAATCATQALDAGERAESRHLIGRALASTGRLALARGKRRDAVDALERAADILRLAGDLPREARVRGLLAEGFLDLGRLRDAHAAIGASLVSAQQRGALSDEASLLVLQARLELERDADRPAAEALARARRVARGRGDIAVSRAAARVESLRHLLGQRPARALAALSKSEGGDKDDRLRAELLTAHAAAMTGDLNAAEAACHSARGWLADGGTDAAWAELALGIASLECAQHAAGVDADAADRAQSRVAQALPGEADRPQWLRLTLRMWQRAWQQAVEGSEA